MSCFMRWEVYVTHHRYIISYMIDSQIVETFQRLRALYCIIIRRLEHLLNLTATVSIQIRDCPGKVPCRMVPIDYCQWIYVTDQSFW